ncbi:MAG: hypothetical protein JST00_23065 [Deltaproteobacteria bacterium]|nr:hypothetical protein [Deltaproteobacteria bacterium]
MAPRRTLRTTTLAITIAATLLGAPARADKIADAEDLFRRAKALMAQGRPSEACPLFQESYRSDPAPGTLLNLALCHEAIGKIATAWGEFRSAEQQARAATPPREDRIQLAREHAEKLEPRLSRIRIVVAPEGRARDLLVKIDGEPKSELLWSGVPVDPGTRVVEASAPGKRPVTLRVKIDDEGVLQSVTIPALEDAPLATAPAGADVRELEEYAANRAKRTTGFVLGGIGLATLAAGSAFGVAAIVNDAEAKECARPCYVDRPEGQASDRATDRALVFANISNVVIPLGAVLTALGAYLVLSAGPSSRPGKTSIGMAPTAGGGAFSLAGVW